MNSKLDQHNLKVHYLLLFVVLCLNTVLLIRDFEVRPAIWNGDDGPAPYANYMKNPHKYEADAFIKNWIYPASGTMQNWLTAFLYVHFNISPIVMGFFLVFLQNVLLGFAVFRYSFIVTKCRDVAWLSVCFTMLAKPYTWNLAQFGDLMYMPYAAHLALPFLVYAASYAIEDKHIKSTVSLLIGCLFHPVVGSFSVVMIGCYWIWRYRSNILSKQSIIKLLTFVIIVVISILPMYFATGNVPQLPNSELLPIVMKNGHTIPWNFQPYMQTFIRNITIIPLFLVLAFFSIQNNSFNKKHVIFWTTSVFVCFILSLLHFIFIIFKVAVLIRLITIRSTLLIMVFSVPFVMLFLLNTLKTESLGIRFIIIRYLIYPHLIFMPLMTALVSVSNQKFKLFKWQFKQIARRCFRITGYLLLFYRILAFDKRTLLVSFFIAASLQSQTVEWITNRISLFRDVMRRVFSKIDLQFFSYTTKEKINFLTKLAIISSMILFSFHISYQRGKADITDEARAYYDVQIWARESTESNASFIMFRPFRLGGWRSVADRPIIATEGTGGYYPASELTTMYSEEIDEFYNKHRIQKSEDRRFLMLDEKGVKDFTSHFGGNYYLLNKSHIQQSSLQIPSRVVYENDFYLVYQIK